jgi:hypothetical protein
VAGDDGIDGHPVASLVAHHVFAYLLDDTPELVAQDGGERDPVVEFTTVDMQICPTDA